jgi:alpha-L-arabinofuranosidase
MQRHPLQFLCASVAACLTLCSASAQEASIVVRADQPGHKIPPTLWGIFFEDINLSADGGIYPEQVRNRNFEDSARPDHWTTISSGAAKVETSIATDKPVSAKNPRSLKVVITEPGTGRAGVANGGFYGMGIAKGASYELSLDARGDGNFTGPLTVSLESTDGLVYAQKKLNKLTADWKKYTLTLAAKGADPKARLVISADQAGTFWLDMVSLMPKKTWKGNGLRPDLMEMLVGLQPAFNRFPGGCWVEGETMKEAYRWKQTIGDLSERRTQHNIWAYEATHAIGYHEYLQMCEDLGCEPLFVINCGMSHRENVPMDKMDEFVQDALDAIEYANGPATSQWGAVRAKAGHPAPFNLKYVEIGNENGGQAYNERWPLFVKAIQARYPEIQLIANHWAGGYPKDPMPAIVDEHYYNNPEFFMRRADMYDKYDRSGPKIYVGEYAVTSGAGLGNLRGAIGEAAFMTGMERNSDVVIMSSYAPLFCNANHKRWPINLINYDSTRVFGIPSYYVQQMFSQNRGDVVLPITVDAPMTEAGAKGGAVGVGTWATKAEFKDIKVTRNGETLAAPDLHDTKGWKLLGNGDWKAQDGVLTQSSTAENIRAVFGDPQWSDYTLSLKARKLSGAEGFLILFRNQRDSEKSWWNLGGWGNQRHALEVGGLEDGSVTGSIETGRWYDIRVELQGSNIKCYLDGKLIHDVKTPGIKSLYASASREEKSGEVILKVVNVAENPLTAEIKLEGVAKVSRPVKVSVLTSGSSTDENTLDQPRKVVPSSQTLEATGSTLRHSFPGNSLTVLRVKAK